MDKIKLPEIFFDAGGKGYWLKTPSQRFLCLDKRDTAIHLIHSGLEVTKEPNSLTSLDRVFMVARLERAVDYAGPLAGHRLGPFMTSAGARILVTSEPRPEVFAKPSAKPNCARIEKFLLELLGPEQLPSVLCWLKIARASLLAGDFRPGQLLVLAGPSNCGKSLFQAMVTEFLGGRAGKPYRYMIGETTFNSDLAAAEHLMIEDESASVDIRARRKFGAAIKDFTVCAEASVHAKGRQAILLPTYKRMTLSVNDEAENLMILPPLDESLLDKVFLCKCSRAQLSENRKENWQNLTAELPGLAAWVASIRVPSSLKCPRFGVVAYHNEEILSMLSAVAPETRLHDLIQEVLWPEKDKDAVTREFQGSAEELEKQLRSSPFSFAVEKLLYFSSATGTYLGRLAQKYPNRFQPLKVRGKSTWKILPP